MLTTEPPTDVIDAVKLALLRKLTTEGKARRIRLRSQLSLSEVAAPIKVTPACVHRWETGQRLPRGEKALAYLKLLEELGK